MKIPNQLVQLSNSSSTVFSDEIQRDKSSIYPQVWQSVSGEWGRSTVILTDPSVCRNGDHVTCLSNGQCHATTISSSIPRCSVHFDGRVWGTSCGHGPLPEADVARAKALWEDFSARYTGRRV